MPIYAYQCLMCEEHFEVVRGLFENALPKCPKCGKNKVEKRITAPNFILKGAGFYVTDSKGGGASPASTEPKKDAPKSESKKSKKA
jgi:putative FmdB family regulatory protein